MVRACGLQQSHFIGASPGPLGSKMPPSIRRTPIRFLEELVDVALDAGAILIGVFFVSKAPLDRACQREARQKCNKRVHGPTHKKTPASNELVDVVATSVIVSAVNAPFQECVAVVNTATVFDAAPSKHIGAAANCVVGVAPKTLTAEVVQLVDAAGVQLAAKNANLTPPLNDAPLKNG
jgi:hypothetical protein